MLRGLAADITGSADNCECIPIDKFNTEDSKKYLIRDETAFIYLKARVEEHIFTDRAYIQIKGEAASGKKRLVRRFDYSHHPLTQVMFETAGMGLTDGDCEIKFAIGNEHVSVDVFKKQADIAIVHYTALCDLSIEMTKRKIKLEQTRSLLASMSLRSDTDGGVKVVLDAMEQLLSSYDKPFTDLLQKYKVNH